MAPRDRDQPKELSPLAIAAALGTGAGVWVLVEMLRHLMS